MNNNNQKYNENNCNNWSDLFSNFRFMQCIYKRKVLIQTITKQWAQINLKFLCIAWLLLLRIEIYFLHVNPFHYVEGNDLLLSVCSTNPSIRPKEIITIYLCRIFLIEITVNEIKFSIFTYIQDITFHIMSYEVLSIEYSYLKFIFGYGLLDVKRFVK